MATSTLEPRPERRDQETLRQRLRRMTKPPRRLTFTRAGKFFMLLTLAVGGGALNTGNNLLFLLLGMMLSAIIASGILSEAVLRKLWLERRAPRRIFANRPAQGSFSIDNPRSYVSLNIEASERHPVAIVGPRAGETLGSRDVPFYKFWVPDAFDDDGYVAISRVGQLEAEQKRAVGARYKFPERGVYRSEGTRLATRFPFGLFHKVVDIDVEQEFVVFPEPLPADDWSGEVAARFGDISRNRAGSGSEYFGLRDWREGEDRRQIHWKSSARRGAFVVREFEEQEQRAIEVILLNATGRQAAAPDRLVRDFEQGLRKLTGLLQDLADKRYRVGFRSFDGALEAGEGIVHLDAMLERLARAELRGGTLPALPASLMISSGPRIQDVARVVVGFEAAIEQCPSTFDLALPIDSI